MLSINHSTKDFWIGESLNETKQHILHYIQHNDSDYFNTNLYERFIVLINTVYYKHLKNAEGVINFDTEDEHKEFIQDCFTNMFNKSLARYNSEQSPFTYFYTCFKNLALHKIYHRYATCRGAAVTSSYDSLDDYDKERIQPTVEPEDIEKGDISRLLTDSLTFNPSSVKRYKSKVMDKYVNFVQSVKDGKYTDLPEFNTQTKCYEWMSEQCGMTPTLLGIQRNTFALKYKMEAGLLSPIDRERIDKRRQLATRGWKKKLEKRKNLSL